MSARRFRTAIILVAILGQAVPSTAQDAGRFPSTSATDTGDAEGQVVRTSPVPSVDHSRR